MRILVTGGAGFIGSHIIDLLLFNRHEVFVLDDESMGVNNVPKGVVQYVRTSLANSEGYIGQMGKLDAVVHCAARADVRDNWTHRQERAKMWHANIAGTATLLEAIGPTPVVFLSTCAVYGDNDNCQEDEACTATSPYAASKLAGEAMVQAYAHKHKVPWHVLRLSCAVGSRYHHGHIRDFVDGARAGVLKPCSDGWAKKSMVHVSDVASAASAAVTGSINPGIYNVASGVWSPRDTVRTMGPSVDVEWPVNKTHGWVGDPMAIAGGHKLRNAGWVPQWSIERGVQDALGYLQWRR